MRLMRHGASFAAMAAALGAAACVPYDQPYRAERSGPAPLYSAPAYPPAYPPAYAPLSPLPPAPPIAVEPLEPAPPRADGPDPFEPRAEPPGPAPDPARADAAPDAPPPSQDPVTDLLLTPLPQRDAASPAPVKPPASAGQDPFMGFRPMRGQTRPTP